MDNSLFEQNREATTSLLQQAQSIGIVVTDNQTLDSMGAGLALFLSLKNANKHVQIVSRKDPIVELSNLFGINKVARNFEGKTNTLTISVPYHEGEIGKVSYNIEGDKLNVNLFGEENGITFSEADVQYIKKGSAPDLVISIGLSDQEELSSFVDLSQPVKIINIDTNPLNAYFGDVYYVDQYFSSFSEVVGLILEVQKLPVDQDIAQNLFDGISSATNSFSDVATSAYAFEAAGFVMRNGARRQQGGVPQIGQQQFGRRQRDRKEVRRPQNIQVNPFQRVQPGNQPPMQPAREPQPQQVQEQGQQEEAPEDNQQVVPSDWFTPKIFKGSKPQS